MKAGSVRAPVLRVGLPRAVGETLCAQVAVALGLLLLEPHLPTRVLGIRGHAGLFPLASLCGVMWGALRLRLAAGPWPRQLGREGVGGIGQGFAIGLPVVGCSWVATAASGTAPGSSRRPAHLAAG